MATALPLGLPDVDTVFFYSIHPSAKTHTQRTTELLMWWCQMLKALSSVSKVVLVFESAFIQDKTPLSAGSVAASRRVHIKGANTDVDRM
jgi:hypothetical protein